MDNSVFAGTRVKGAILAGGPSTRMARPKAGLVVGGRSIIERELDVLRGVFGEASIVARSPEGYEGYGARVILDPPGFEGLSGPLKGVYAALRDADGASVFMVGCDMPFILPALVGHLASLADGIHAVVPVVKGYREPLFAIYPPSAADAAHSLLLSGRMKLALLLAELNVMEVGEPELRKYDPELVSFTNVNTPDELERAREAALKIDAADRTGEGRGALDRMRA